MPDDETAKPWHLIANTADITETLPVRNQGAGISIFFTVSMVSAFLYSVSWSLKHLGDENF